MDTAFEHQIAELHQILALNDEALRAVGEGRQLPVDVLDALPPVRAAALVRVARRAGVITAQYATELTEKVDLADLDAGPGWLTGRPHYRCPDCLTVTFEVGFVFTETCARRCFSLSERRTVAEVAEGLCVCGDLGQVCTCGERVVTGNTPEPPTSTHS